MSSPAATGGGERNDKLVVKCVVWDLDHTLWDGVLLEDRSIRLRPAAVDVIKALDERGILHSIASRNDHDAAMAKLTELGIAGYFLHPQIGWGTKSAAVGAIARALNISLDAIAFVDDQPFERDEVRFTHPTVRCIDAEHLARIPEMQEMIPRFITDDSRMRRAMYLADIERQKAEETRAPDEFLASLDMHLVIAPAREQDLMRAEELTLRTNQLNATGYTYSYDELDTFRRSPNYELLIASLADRYGSYGKIGLSLVERGSAAWTIKLLVMSCRVMSRGVGTVMLNHILREARRAGVALRAEFVATDRNRAMYIAYKFAGFREVETDGRRAILVADLGKIPDFPPYMKIELGGP